MTDSKRLPPNNKTFPDDKDGKIVEQLRKDIQEWQKINFPPDEKKLNWYVARRHKVQIYCDERSVLVITAKRLLMNDLLNILNEDQKENLTLLSQVIKDWKGGLTEYKENKNSNKPGLNKYDLLSIRTGLTSPKTKEIIDKAERSLRAPVNKPPPLKKI